jgi:hypothetical protein
MFMTCLKHRVEKPSKNVIYYEYRENLPFDIDYLNLITRFAPHFLRKLELYPETIIIAASQSGLDVLVTYGQKIFFIDGTHSLLEGKMQLTEIAIKVRLWCSLCIYDIKRKNINSLQTIY